VVIEVQDNGPGIPHDKKERIFIMFQTLHSLDRFGVKGTGIGLNTVKKLVELMQGTIEVDSEITEGTIFRVRLPQG
jgi:signal transduction histidine kinase